MLQLVNGVFMIIQLAILGRVLYTWIDPNPYPTNEVKRVLWAVTDPILEPLRRVIPPLGMFDISPIVAFVLLQVVQQAVVSLLFPYGY